MDLLACRWGSATIRGELFERIEGKRSATRDSKPDPLPGTAVRRYETAGGCRYLLPAEPATRAFWHCVCRSALCPKTGCSNIAWGSKRNCGPGVRFPGTP